MSDCASGRCRRVAPAAGSRSAGRRGRTTNVHSLGAKPISGGLLTVEDAAGNALARAPIPAMEAPADLRPRIARVVVALPAAARSKARRVRIVSSGGTPETTLLNNSVEIH